MIPPPVIQLKSGEWLLLFAQVKDEKRLKLAEAEEKTKQNNRTNDYKHATEYLRNMQRKQTNKREKEGKKRSVQQHADSPMVGCNTCDPH